MEEKVRLDGLVLNLHTTAAVVAAATAAAEIRTSPDDNSRVPLPLPWMRLRSTREHIVDTRAALDFRRTQQHSNRPADLHSHLQSAKTFVLVKASIRVRNELIPAQVLGPSHAAFDKRTRQWAFPSLSITWAHPALCPSDQENGNSYLVIEFQASHGIAAKRTIQLGSCKVDIHTIATGPKHQDLPLAGPPRSANFRIQCDLTFQQHAQRCFFSLNHHQPLQVHWDHNSNLAPKRPYVGVKYGVSMSMATTTSRANRHIWDNSEIVGCYATPNQSLSDILHSELVIQVHDEADKNKLLGAAVIKIHSYWHASFPNANGAQFLVDCRTQNGRLVGHMTGRLLIQGAPHFHQMIGGVRNEDGISNARPLIFGVPLPTGTHASRMVRTWDSDDRHVRLTDSFGFLYFYDFQTRACVWKRVDEDEDDNPRESELQKTFGSGPQTTWIHPAAESISLPNGDLDASQFGAAEPIMIRRNRNVLLAEEAAAARASETQIDTGDLNLTDANGCATDMLFSHLGTIRGPADMDAGPASEGHSLAVVNDWKEAIKFGGGDGINWFNDTHKFDIQDMSWRKVKTMGTSPVGRTGHGVAVLGSQSRMAVFGGASRKGRLNDLHIYNSVRTSWTSVNVESKPVPRARLGMAPAHSDDGFWLFGGRQGYRYLGDKYFNDLHFFDASSIQWIPVRPTTSALPARRCGMVTELIDYRLLFVHGGYEDSQSYYDDTWLFDTVSYQWVRPPYQDPSVLPSARESHTSSVVGHSVVIYGGESERGYHNDVYVFDTISKRWVGKPYTSGHSPGSRTGAASVTIDDRRLLIVGGDQGLRFNSDSLTLDVAHAQVSDLDRIQRRTLEHGPDSDACCVCMERDTSQTFLWCGHTVCCFQCAPRMRTCPICRSYVSRTLPIDVS